MTMNLGPFCVIICHETQWVVVGAWVLEYGELVPLGVVKSVILIVSRWRLPLFFRELCE